MKGCRSFISGAFFEQLFGDPITVFQRSQLNYGGCNSIGLAEAHYERVMINRRHLVRVG